MIAITKGVVDALAYILEPANKRDVGEVLKKNLRLSKDEDVEASYRVSRLQMPNLDIAPNLEAWRTVQTAGRPGKSQSAGSRPRTSDRYRRRRNFLESQRLHAGDEKEIAAMTRFVQSRQSTLNF